MIPAIFGLSGLTLTDDELDWFFARLEAAGIPEVRGVWAHETGGGRLLDPDFRISTTGADGDVTRTVRAPDGQRRELEGEIVDHTFFDIGTPEDLAKTRAAFEGEGE